MTHPAAQGPSRRGVLIGLGAGVAVGALATAGTTAVVTAAGGASAPGSGVPAEGANQAGIARPETPQRHGLVAVYSAPAALTQKALADGLAAAGRAVLELTRGASDALPEGPGDLTLTIGVGPRLVRLVDSALPGAEHLPAFAGDDTISAERNGGDLLLSASASDPGVLGPAVDRVAAAFPGLVAAWHERVFRAAGTGTVTRNPLGYLDGIQVPHGTEELAENVWIADGAASGGTVCVIRRLRLDIDRFSAEPLAHRDAIVGRHRLDGSPLSGGDRDDPVNLLTKTEAGDYLTPARSHARAAHPSFTGSRLMLRRGYAFDAGPDDRGLLFVCFQNELDTFVKTQRRLDELDDLMAFAHPTASASFLVLPGYSDDRPLGATLFAR